MSNLIRTAEHRRVKRYAVSGKMRVLWEPGDGQSQVCLAQLVDISATGMKILVDVQMTPRTYVTVNDRDLGIMGRGSVRYCRFQKGKFAVGLECSGGTGWTPPAEPLSPPLAGPVETPFQAGASSDIQS